ncbi:MAG: MBOAT family O-acyltransferase [Thermodesulfobacteriota bacterium]
MTDFQILLFLWLFSTVILVWIMPKKWQLDLIAVSSLAFIGIFSPWSCAWLIGASLLVYTSTAVSPRSRPILIAVAILVISIVFVVYKGLAPSLENASVALPVMLGLSYYSCRHIHVLLEVYKGAISSISLREYFHYQFFLPVLVAGPIHRFQNFKRQSERRRLDKYDITSGLERILYGYVKIVLIGNYLLNAKLGVYLDQHVSDGFLGLFLLSAEHWLYIYAEFSGYTDVALGFSLMMGFRIEENFNYPLRARNLIDFWERWHITLSGWCKDYVFSPVQAKTRNQLFAVFSAMVVMGIWHEVSLYYFLWGLYHALGISLCRFYQLSKDPLKLSAMPAGVRGAITGAATFGWLIGGTPVIMLVLSFIGMS